MIPEKNYDQQRIQKRSLKLLIEIVLFYEHEVFFSSIKGENKEEEEEKKFSGDINEVNFLKKELEKINQFVESH